MPLANVLEELGENILVMFPHTFVFQAPLRDPEYAHLVITWR
jgi:hypothetical protein